MSEPQNPDKAPKSEAVASRSRLKKSKVLPTNRVAFARQLDILRAYAIHGEAGSFVTNEQVSSTVGIKAETASLCNAFFLDVQLLQRTDRGYVPSQEVLSFKRAWEWDKETASRKLAPVLEKTWFAAMLTPTLKFRAMEERAAINALAEASGAAKEHEPQLRLLLDYLEAAGIIARDGSSIKFSGATFDPAQIVSVDPPYSASAPKAEVVAARERHSNEAIPVALGRGRLAYVELPVDWDAVRDLDRFLRILRISLTEDASVVAEDKEGK